MSKQVSWVVSAVAATLFTLSAQASEFLPAAGNWGDSGNWSGNSVPGFGNADDALLDLGGSAIVNGIFAPNNVNLSSGQITGTTLSSLTVGGIFQWTGGSIGAGANVVLPNSALLGDVSATINDPVLPAPLTNAGNVAFNSSPISAPLFGLNSTGNISLGNGVNLNLTNGSTISGNITSNFATSLIHLSYDSSVNANNVHQLTGNITTLGNVLVDGADFSVGANSTVAAANFTVTGANSYLRGSGTINGAADLQSATIYPGDEGPVGTLRFAGHTRIEQTSSLISDITRDGGNDLVQIAGTADIDDLQLAVEIPDGTVPRYGQSFTVLTATRFDQTPTIDDGSFIDGLVPGYDDLSGAYIDGGFTVAIGATNIVLTYVPEPTVLLPVLLGTLALRRRRLS